MSRRLRILDGDRSDDDRVAIDVVKHRKRGKEKDPSICHELMMDVWVRRAMLVGLHVDALRRLISFCVPPVLFGVMAYIARSRHFNGEDLDCVELFSGKGMLSQGLADEGWRGIAIDLQTKAVSAESDDARRLAVCNLADHALAICPRFQSQRHGVFIVGLPGG